MRAPSTTHRHTAPALALAALLAPLAALPAPRPADAQTAQALRPRSAQTPQVSPASPEAVATDTVDQPLFREGDGVVAGAFLLGTALAFPLDRTLAAAIRDPAVQGAPGLEGAAWVFNRVAVPGAFIASAGLYGAGLVTGRDALADVGLHVGESLVVASAATYAVKFLAGRARPALDMTDPFDFAVGRGLSDEEYRAFPSGHTTVAFAAAAATAAELNRRWPDHEGLVAALTYGPATLVGLTRMYDNRHWASDVVLGAAIGSFTGWLVVRYNHSRVTVFDRWLLGAAVTPAPGGVRIGLTARLTDAER